jgi:FtsP/CotA-like multicopper oxidase with cupredoxin domain
MGLGIVVEYADQRGVPQWLAPPETPWDYKMFGFEKDRRRARRLQSLEYQRKVVAFNDHSVPRRTSVSSSPTNPLFTTEVGKRYRLVMINNSGDNHPVRLHRHGFEVTRVGNTSTAGVMKDTVNMTRMSSVEIDFVADDPGPTLLHHHQDHQDHQDEGFMGLVIYL